MPNARKKRQAKNEDFKKTRLKVGKKKAVADNFTDTSFKSKTISLPNQSITEDKSNLLTNSRNLTLSTLLSQMRHYSAGTRKEAIQQIQDMCEKHPGLLSASLNSIVNASLKILVDEDRDVRKALLQFLKSSFPELEKTEIVPFLSLLTIYTCSAITHIYEDVRADAIKFMDLWIDLAPEFIVSRYWDKVLGNYISLIAVDSNASNISKAHVSGLPNMTSNMTSSSVKNVASKSGLHSHKAKVDVLSSIYNLLNAGLSRGSNDPYWFFVEYLSDESAKKRFRLKFLNKQDGGDMDQITWHADGTVNYKPSDPKAQSFAPTLTNSAYATSSFSHLNLFESTDINSGTGITAKEQGKSNTSDESAPDSKSTASREYDNTKSLIQIFQPSLLSAWLDTAPSVFSASAPITYTPALQTLHLVLKIMAVLWRASLNDNIGEDMTIGFLNTQLEVILKHFMTYFPYGRDSLGRRDQKADATIQEMNIIICELTSLFLMAIKTIQAREMATFNTSSSKLTQVKASGKRKQPVTEKPQALASWTDHVVDHVLDLLGRENLNQNAAKKPKLTVMPEGMTTATSDFRADQLQALLPSIWGLLNSLPTDEQTELFEAFLAYYNRLGANSQSKHIALGFLSRVYMIQFEPQYNGNFTVRHNAIFTEKMRVWLLTLPKLLWEIRSNNLETTANILDLLCSVAKHGGEKLFGQQFFVSLQMSLIPYFFVNLSTKGEVFGPFISLPHQQQRQVVEFLYYSSNIPEKLLTAINRCRQDDILSSETQCYFQEILHL
ncbi:hypothetical protein K450DRAFT_249529 [Umbelopsis ramanniana AG]|uniref:Pre-rRNA-processing protein n=1 Tax=Umbelopsis ramanniana AG TaxID=1314678 RepID=A0AAD5E810_UMBRA|nr:uncharacterized protein K450DRAFT_249529 [Umbelopsis ramanniana AG]KAI8578021.1 hypothetical protein K450DRAFT_249529 [Umbelopsis ramanniana AG]